MVDICPTITANDLQQYREQLARIEHFAHRIHVDLMDGVFAPTHSPRLVDIWLPQNILTDLHVMYADPTAYIQQIIRLKPHTAIVHAESKGDLVGMAHELHNNRINVGVALLADTPVDDAGGVMDVADHVLIFSGHLGFHGGMADMRLLNKVAQVRQRNPHAEIAWDGGINDQNAVALVQAGVEVLNVGGYVQNATNPQAAYAKLEQLLQQQTP